MTTIQDRQLEAYRRIVALMNTPAYQEWVQHSPHAFCVPCEIQKIVDDVSFAEGELAHTIESIKFELSRTRFARLPRAQFMYLAIDDNPRIDRHGMISYLQMHASVYDVPKHSAYEAIANLEYETWHTEPEEAKVFWKDWTIFELSDTHYRISTNWAIAFIYEGHVYADRSEFPPKKDTVLQRVAGGPLGIQTVTSFASWGSE
jgi:hypothetical protein